MAEPEEMYQCQSANCGYIYDPDRGDRRGKIPKGTRFEDLPEDWKCPVCGASKKKCSGRWLVRDPLKMTIIGRDLETTSRKYTCKNRFI